MSYDDYLAGYTEGIREKANYGLLKMIQAYASAIIIVGGSHCNSETPNTLNSRELDQRVSVVFLDPNLRDDVEPHKFNTDRSITPDSENPHHFRVDN